MDLWFADQKSKTSHNCEICSKNPANMASRRCQEPGFDNLKKPRKVDNDGVELNFCPGKATWYGEIAILFQQCRVALETGILPKEGSLEDQDELFTEVFYTFVERWRTRQYRLLWKDISEFAEVALKALFGGK